LRHMLLDSLGEIDEVLVTDRFFRAELADELQGQPEFGEYFDRAVAAILVEGTLDNPRSEGALRAASVTVIGCDDRFAALGHGGPEHWPAPGEIVPNELVAAEIGAQQGDEVLLRIGSVSQIPPDSPLGRKTETIRNRRLKVSAVIPAEGLARFALRPNQQLSRDAFVARSSLEDVLDQPRKVNAIFVASQNSRGTTLAAHDALQRSLHPTLADYGLRIEIHRLGYAQCTSTRMLLEPAAVSAIHKAFAGDRPQDLFTYLANTIALGERGIPYSTITAMDFVSEPPLGPFQSPQGGDLKPLLDDEIALNSWAAEDLGARVGSEVRLTYFEPQSTHGEVRESQATFRVKAIVALEGLAADPDLTPQMPGVTDRLSIGDWDAPFPFNPSRVRKPDEKYWDEYRTTPKAFLALAAGRRLWSSRFGDATAVRFAPPPETTVEQLSAKLVLEPADFGFKFIPLRRMGLAAATGATSFDMLFIGFSFFIMISSLLLVALLFRLTIDQRAEEIGILRSVGLRQRRIATVLLGEGLIVAAIG
ncbi:MAG TPA: ABC transporter permease, partial [Pirellulales bacterium]|nr:ABC transporter permease [Pirellulales bacterium]